MMARQGHYNNLSISKNGDAISYEAADAPENSSWSSILVS